MPPHTAANLRLRAHHLLCVFGFRDLGYSDAFVANMRRIVDAFYSKQGVEVELVAGPDDICGACPHMREGKCRATQDADEAVRAKDACVSDRLGLLPGGRYNSSWLACRTVAGIAPEALADICGGCRWLSAGYCAEGLARRRGQLSGAREEGTGSASHRG